MLLGGGGGNPRVSPSPPPVSNTDSYYISAGLVLAPPEGFLTQKNVTLQFSSLPQYQQSCGCHISSLPHCLRAVILSHHNTLCTITFPPSMQVTSVVLLYCCCHQQFSAIATSAVFLPLHRQSSS